MTNYGANFVANLSEESQPQISHLGVLHMQAQILSTETQMKFSKFHHENKFGTRNLSSQFAGDPHHRAKENNAQLRYDLDTRSNSLFNKPPLTDMEPYYLNSTYDMHFDLEMDDCLVFQNKHFPRRNMRQKNNTEVDLVDYNMGDKSSSKISPYNISFSHKVHNRKLASSSATADEGLGTSQYARSAYHPRNIQSVRSKPPNVLSVESSSNRESATSKLSRKKNWNAHSSNKHESKDYGDIKLQPMGDNVKANDATDTYLTQLIETVSKTDTATNTSSGDVKMSGSNDGTKFTAGTENELISQTSMELSDSEHMTVLFEPHVTDTANNSSIEHIDVALHKLENEKILYYDIKTSIFKNEGKSDVSLMRCKTSVPYKQVENKNSENSSLENVHMETSMIHPNTSEETDNFRESDSSKKRSEGTISPVDSIRQNIDRTYLKYSLDYKVYTKENEKYLLLHNKRMGTIECVQHVQTDKNTKKSLNNRTFIVTTSSDTLSTRKHQQKSKSETKNHLEENNLKVFTSRTESTSCISDSSVISLQVKKSNCCSTCGKKQKWLSDDRKEHECFYLNAVSSSDTLVSNHKRLQDFSQHNKNVLTSTNSTQSWEESSVRSLKLREENISYSSFGDAYWQALETYWFLSQLNSNLEVSDKRRDHLHSQSPRNFHRVNNSFIAREVDEICGTGLNERCYSLGSYAGSIFATRSNLAVASSNSDVYGGNEEYSPTYPIPAEPNLHKYFKRSAMLGFKMKQCLSKKHQDYEMYKCDVSLDSEITKTPYIQNNFLTNGKFFLTENGLSNTLFPYFDLLPCHNIISPFETMQNMQRNVLNYHSKECYQQYDDFYFGTNNQTFSSTNTTSPLKRTYETTQSSKLNENTFQLAEMTGNSEHLGSKSVTHIGNSAISKDLKQLDDVDENVSNLSSISSLGDGNLNIVIREDGSIFLEQCEDTRPQFADSRVDRITHNENFKNKAEINVIHGGESFECRSSSEIIQNNASGEEVPSNKVVPCTDENKNYYKLGETLADTLSETFENQTFHGVFRNDPRGSLEIQENDGNSSSLPVKICRVNHCSSESSCASSRCASESLAKQSSVQALHCNRDSECLIDSGRNESSSENQVIQVPVRIMIPPETSKSNINIVIKVCCLDN